MAIHSACELQDAWRQGGDIYSTLGRYDIVTTIDAPDDLAVTALGLSLGKSGNIRTETLRAFSQSDIDAISRKVA